MIWTPCWPTLQCPRCRGCKHDKGGLLQRAIRYQHNVDPISAIFAMSTILKKHCALDISHRFSICRHPSFSRSFHVNKYYYGCPADIGWMVVLGRRNLLSFEKRHKQTKFILFSGRWFVNYQSGLTDREPMYYLISLFISVIFKRN